MPRRDLVGLVLERAPRSPSAEAFRSLRTALEFLGSKPTRALVVTSPGPREGKTTCTANLGAALARVGRRVLLVDADLRQPGLHRIFGLGRSQQGLSHILAGQCGDELIQGTVVEGLEVLASGSMPPNPAELLERPALDAAVQRWQQRYDHVLFDTPPVLPVTDAVVLARKVGHALMVARVAQTRDRALQQAVEQLRGAGAQVLGVVLNDLISADGWHYRYSYYYGRPGQGEGSSQDR